MEPFHILDATLSKGEDEDETTLHISLRVLLNQ